MIRREIATAAAVAAAFLTAGLLTSPDESTRPVPPPPAPTEVRSDAPIEPPPGYMPHTQPFLTWPEAPSASPTLTWPPAGCDAGMWNVEYQLEQVEARATQVVATNHRGEKVVYEVPHNDGWSLDLHPRTPQRAWAVATDWQSPTFVVRRMDDGATSCVYEREVSQSGEPIETRATLTEDGVIVHVLNDDVWGAFELNNDCELIGERIIDGALTSPPVSEDGVLTMSTDDDGTVYLKVIEYDGRVRWEESFPTDGLRTPITHVMLRDGMLSVRGPLDSYRQHKDRVRIYDTRANEMVGEAPAHLVNPQPLRWRRPPPRDFDVPLTQSSIWSNDWTSCEGVIGWTTLEAPPCDGERVSYRLMHEDDRTIVQLTSTLREESSTCGLGIEVPAHARLHTTLQGGVLSAFAETDDELRGWEFDFDCTLLRETRLPRPELRR